MQQLLHKQLQDTIFELYYYYNPLYTYNHMNPMLLLLDY
jgi:hypothetical protein